MNLLEKAAGLFKPKDESDSKNAMKIVNEVKKDLSNYRLQFEQNWKEEEKAYHGDIWENTNEKKPYENHIFQIIEGEVPILTDSIPSTTIEVKEPEKRMQAENLGKAVEWVYQDQNFPLMYPMVVRDSLLSAPGFIYQYYDYNAKNGDGQIKNEILNWRQVKLAGNSLFVDDCDSAQFEVSRSKSWLKRAYPKMAEQIAKIDAEEKLSDNDSTRGRETVDTGQRATRKAPAPYKNKDTLCLTITYVRDYSLEPISQDETLEELSSEKEALANGESPDVKVYQDHDAHIAEHDNELAALYSELGLTPDQGFDAAEQLIEQVLAESPESGADAILLKIKLLETHKEMHLTLKEENPTSERPKYPGGYRVIESVNSTVLYDGVNKYKHGQIPLVPFYCYRNNSIYGFGEIRNILDSQRMQAVMGYKAYKGLQKVANPEKIANHTSGLTKDDVTNEDGAVYILPDGGTLQNIPPGVISEQVIRFKDERIVSMQSISGMTEVTQGKLPSPNAAAVTVEKTQQMAIGRVRLKDRQNTYYSIKRLGYFTASNILQFWTTEKTLKLEDQGGQISPIVYNPLEMEDLQWDVGIASGSMAGVDKESFNNLLTVYLNSGHLRFDEYLEFVDIPKAPKILEVVKARMNSEAQMQELQTQNLKLKGQFAPELLTPEEAAAFKQMQQAEMMQQLTEANPGQSGQV